jgi:prepilin-type N-terminal cleavage/methylation domain-containing protein
MTKQHSRGLTLLEISIVMALMTVIMLVTAVVLVRSARTWREQERFVEVSATLRQAALVLQRELAEAALKEKDDYKVKVAALDHRPGGSRVTFQRPLSMDGAEWTRPITFRLRNEDKNANLALDGDEDEDSNGLLDRVLERVEDVNGDGDYDDVTETKVLCRNLDGLIFDRENNSRTLNVTLIARTRLRSEARVPDEIRHTFTVFVRN